MIRRRFIVTGTVQGVGFRWFVKEQAQMLGLAGFTRNLSDGSVEVQAEGPAVLLTTLEERLREGPGSAHVDRVKVEDIPLRNESSFDILSRERSA
jgi:acylphosphatase